MDHSSFKDPRGVLRTGSLFLELIVQKSRDYGVEPVFTLKDYDHNGCKSFKRLYMSYMDVTGYKAAIGILGSWKHFNKLLNNQKIRSLVSDWNEEIEVKLRSQGLEVIIEESKEGKSRFTAAKFLVDKGWSNKRGRPTKNEVERERVQRAKVKSSLQEDSARILSIAGGKK